MHHTLLPVLLSFIVAVLRNIAVVFLQFQYLVFHLLIFTACSMFDVHSAVLLSSVCLVVTYIEIMESNFTC